MESQPQSQFSFKHNLLFLVKQKKFIFGLLGVAFIGGLVAFLFLNRSQLINQQWSAEKAAYLARRALLDPTPQDIQKLTSASSAKNAVDLLFASASPQEVQAYQNGLSQLQSKKNTYKSDITYNDVEYTYAMIHDPNRAQRMLYYLWENIFSVDGSEKDDGILYDDVKTLHEAIYNDTFGNYLQMVEDVRNNYAMARYLDLTNSPKNDPNENFARELMQLFLIGPYTPLDKAQTQLNYADADVNALAFILTGYKVNKQSRTIYLDPKAHYSGMKTFLGSEYNDPVHIISYIEQQKKHEMAEFLANKLLHYYVTDTPSDADILAVTKMVENNNFVILPIVKELLASDIMYNLTYMHQTRFKSPPQLVTSFYTALYGRDVFDVIPAANILTDLDFQPYRPGSIFGRDGFNNNQLFYSGTIIDKWIGDTHTLLAQNTRAVVNLIAASQDATQLIDTLTQKLNFSTPLPSSVKDKLIAYEHNFSPRLKKSKQNQEDIGLLGLMFAQPEFLLLGGTVDTQMASNAVSSLSNSNSPILVVVRIKGGYDYQQLVANIADPAYAVNRKQAALNSTNSSSLGNGYVLNNAAASLVPLIQQKQAFFISGVGLPNHSRAHDVASKQMETGLLDNGNGILSQFASVLPTTKLISFTNIPPIMLKGGQSLQIGSTNLALFPQRNNNQSMEEQVLKNIFSEREFPNVLAPYYQQALLLDTLAKENIASGGKGTPGNTTTTQLPFLEGLIDHQVGNTYYLYADGTYDTHVDEDLNFDKQIKNLLDNLTKFYNDEKGKRKIAIVVFSEFGRTDKINGGKGTDHGTGGGMVVISNAVNWPEMVGSLTPSTDKYNWSEVKVDERDVWASLFHDLYGLSQEAIFNGSKTISSYTATIH
ncbi:MAG TPA: DUF1800 family protein [Patescibacteria group bacterium]